MSRALLLRLFVLLALLFGNVALWGSKRVAAAPSMGYCTISNQGYLCIGTCSGNQECCSNEDYCDL